jgi:hypothetical protein
MFTQHPKSEFFDVDIFIEENMSSIRHIYEQVVDVFPKDDSDYHTEIALMVAVAIYNDSLYVEMPLDFDPEDEKGICDLAGHLLTLMVLFSLEDSEQVKRIGDKWSLTPEGMETAKKIVDGIQ